MYIYIIYAYTWHEMASHVILLLIFSHICEAPGTLAVQRGMRVWVNETEQHPEWVSGQRCKARGFRWGFSDGMGRPFRGRLSDCGRRWTQIVISDFSFWGWLLTWNTNLVLGFTNHCKKMLRLLKKQTVPVFFYQNFGCHEALSKPCWSLLVVVIVVVLLVVVFRLHHPRFASIPHGFDSRRTTTSPGSRIPRGCHAAFWSQRYTWCQEPQLWPLWKIMAI